jgi:hypothetical protein
MAAGLLAAMGILSSYGCGTSDREVSADSEARFQSLIRTIQDECLRINGGDGEIDKADAAIGELAEFVRVHRNDSFAPLAPGAGATQVRWLVSVLVWDVSCPTRETVALRRIAPVPLEPHALAPGDRIALAVAKVDLRERCQHPDKRRLDTRHVRSDVATFRRLGRKWPPLWSYLGFVLVEPPGGWGDAGRPSFDPYFNVTACAVPNAMTLLKKSIPEGADSVFD